MTIAMQHDLQAPAGRTTMREFQALPEGLLYYEFERGKLISMVSPTSRHQDLLFLLTRVLKDFILAQRLGRIFFDVDVYLGAFISDHDPLTTRLQILQGPRRP